MITIISFLYANTVRKSWPRGYMDSRISCLWLHSNSVWSLEKLFASMTFSCFMSKVRITIILTYSIVQWGNPRKHKKKIWHKETAQQILYLCLLLHLFLLLSSFSSWFLNTTLHLRLLTTEICTYFLLNLLIWHIFYILFLF